MRRTARAAAVLAGSLSLAGTGTLVAAGVAWSDGGTGARSAHGSTATHKTATGRAAGGQAGANGSTPSSQTTSKPGAGRSGNGSNSGASKSKGKSGSKAKQAKPKPQPQAKPKPKPKPKPIVRLSAALLGTIGFPQRALGLWTSPLTPLSASAVNVSENGQPVGPVQLTPLSRAPSSDFGVVVVLDESSSLSANSRGLELADAEAIAAKRTGSERFGVISFGGTPQVMLPVTSNSQLIRAALSAAPVLTPGSSVDPALALAYQQLHRAGVPVGAVVVVTAGKDLANPVSEGAVSQTGLRLGYQTFTTDITAGSAIAGSSGGSSSGSSDSADKSSSVSTGTGSSGDGDNDAAQEKALGAQLDDSAGVWTRLTGGYLATYRSSARVGQAVLVSVSADGDTGTPVLGYTATRPPVGAGLPAPSLQALREFPALSRYPAFARFTPASAPTTHGSASTSFWASPLSLILVALGCGLLLTLALGLVVSGVGRSEVEARVARFIPEERTEEDAGALDLVAPGVPGILGRRKWWPGFVLHVEVAHFRRSPVSLVKIAVSGSLVAAVLFTVLLGSVAGALLGLPIGPIVLYAALKRAVRKNRARFAEQLPSHLQDMAGAMRGGRSMAGAMLAVVDGAEQPTLGEFERVVADEQLGRPLETSLHTVAERMKSPDMEQVALVAALHRRSGSSVAEALDHVAEGARERSELIRELNSLTGQARLSSRILTGLPVMLLLALNVIDPGYMHPLLNTVGGIVVLVMCALMVGSGWLIMKRMVNVEA